MGRRLRVLAAVVITFLAAACSGGSHAPTASTGGSPTTSTPAISSTPGGEAPVAGILSYTDTSGYSYKIRYSSYFADPQVYVADQPSGYSAIMVGLDNYVAVSNTTPGREAPPLLGLGIALTFKSSDPMCSGNGQVVDGLCLVFIFDTPDPTEESPPTDIGVDSQVRLGSLPGYGVGRHEIVTHIPDAQSTEALNEFTGHQYGVVVVLRSNNTHPASDPACFVGVIPLTFIYSTTPITCPTNQNPVGTP